MLPQDELTSDVRHLPISHLEYTGKKLSATRTILILKPVNWSIDGNIRLNLGFWFVTSNIVHRINLFSFASYLASQIQFMKNIKEAIAVNILLTKIFNWISSAAAWLSNFQESMHYANWGLRGQKIFLTLMDILRWTHFEG